MRCTSHLRVTFSLFSIVFAANLLHAQVQTAPPSESLAREYLAGCATEQSKGTLKLVSFRKTDGISRQVDGVPVYQLEFEAEIQVLQDLKWTKELFDENFNGFSTTITDAQAQKEGGVWGGFFNASQNTGLEFKRGTLVHL